MRQAATAGGVSNTTWSRFESGVGQLTPGIVQAVARAFDWPTDWPDNPPTVSPPVDAQTVTRLAQAVERLTHRVDVLQDVVDEQQRAIASLRSSPRRG